MSTTPLRPVDHPLSGYRMELQRLRAMDAEHFGLDDLAVAPILVALTVVTRLTKP